MGRIVELPSIKPRSTSRRQGLRKLSPDLISKARDETGTQVTRIALTFLGTTAFCLLSLLSPDTALLGGNEKINVPFAGPVSFFGFMLLGPAVLIMLRIYLQIYVEHSDRLDQLARSVSVVRAPTLVPLRNPLIRVFSGLTFYLLLPVAMMLFAWKAAVFPAWGSGLLCVATGAVVSHVMLPFSRFSWRSKGLLSISAAIISAAIIAGGVMLGFGPPHRPFDLFRANLSDQWLVGEDFRKANLELANLRSANLDNGNLSDANLNGADLDHANLRSANLDHGNLSDANLSSANLDHANLSSANLDQGNLSDANLNGADLSDANLSDAKLMGAYLYNAKLSGAYLHLADLSGAYLHLAYLSGADLSGADLSGADLSDVNPALDLSDATGADLRNAKLIGADLSRADLRNTNLSGVDLSGAHLTGADLSYANLSDAENLTQTQLDEACGNANTKLPEGLTLKSCSTDR